MTPKTTMLIAALLGLLPLTSECQGQSGITVTGRGLVEVKPTHLVVSTEVQGEAELAADAMGKFRDAKEQALEAFDKLGLEKLVVKGDGIAVSNSAVNPQMMNVFVQGQQQSAPEPRFLVSEKLELTLAAIDELEIGTLLEQVMKILDAAKEQGLGLAGGGAINPWQQQMRQGGRFSLATFKVADEGSVRAQAYQRAMTDAREAAQRLADLAGVRLGKVVSIRDMGEVPRTAVSQQANIFWGTAVTTSEDQKPLTRAELAPISFKVQLSVVFDIAE